MKYNQHIPYYISKFRAFPWKIYASERFLFHVRAESIAENEINFIQTQQEAAYAKILTCLKLEDPQRKILYYLYQSRDEKADLMGDDWYAQAICDEFVVHAVYNQTIKVVGEHEATHLLSLPMGFPIGLFQEGLAEFLTGSSIFGNNHKTVVKKGIERGIFCGLRNLMSQEMWMNTPENETEFYYAVAGTFIRYLVEALGIDEFKKLYSVMSRQNSGKDNRKILASYMQQDIEKIEHDWLISIL